MKNGGRQPAAPAPHHRLRAYTNLLDLDRINNSIWQGGWEDDEDVYQAASRETLEEAGVKGVIHVRHQCLPFHSFTHGLSSCCLPINPHPLLSSILRRPSTRFRNDDADLI